MKPRVYLNPPGMKIKVRKVPGVQAEMAKRLGLTKITRESAKNLFSFGVELVVVGSKVNDYHFFGGWHLAMHVDPVRYHHEGVGFEHFVNNWSSYNENPETGKIAFFVEDKFL